ncbi:hypothetical protein BCR36DRAFT_415634 [Piromyces finnis]|uniref:Uncharacterized protein n=1 Tax=Piromyces finnis TaxID=1754191 RepID=A0A1Y1UZB5_9FUNG|nr:hypothetical protein BCR36DRAFT_415634 [Piromyces finnis]|eukprot:ORX43224.1 hypothetical protein BCR36DRAFT_415634 [Piromyces finnis]
MKSRYQEIINTIIKRDEVENNKVDEKGEEESLKDTNKSTTSSDKPTNEVQSETTKTKSVEVATTSTVIQTTQVNIIPTATTTENQLTTSIPMVTETPIITSTTETISITTTSSEATGRVISFDNNKLPSSNKTFYISVLAVVGGFIILVIIFICFLINYRKNKNKSNKIPTMVPRSISLNGMDNRGSIIIPHYSKARNSQLSFQDDANLNDISFYSNASRFSMQQINNTGVNDSPASHQTKFYSDINHPLTTNINRNSFNGNRPMSYNQASPGNISNSPLMNANFASPILSRNRNINSGSINQNHHWSISSSAHLSSPSHRSSYQNGLQGSHESILPIASDKMEIDEDTDIVNDINNALPSLVIENGDITSFSKNLEKNNILRSSTLESNYLNQSSFSSYRQDNHSNSRVISPRIESLNMKSSMIMEGYHLDRSDRSPMMESSSPLKYTDMDRSFPTIPKRNSSYIASPHLSNVNANYYGHGDESFFSNDHSLAISTNQVIPKIIEPNIIIEPMVPEIMETVSSNPTDSIHQNIEDGSTKNLLPINIMERPVSFPQVKPSHISEEFNSSRPNSFQESNNAKIKTLKEENPNYLKPYVSNIIEDEEVMKNI